MRMRYKSCRLYWPLSSLIVLALCTIPRETSCQQPPPSPSDRRSERSSKAVEPKMTDLDAAIQLAEEQEASVRRAFELLLLSKMGLTSRPPRRARPAQVPHALSQVYKSSLADSADNDAAAAASYYDTVRAFSAEGELCPVTSHFIAQLLLHYVFRSTCDTCNRFGHRAQMLIFPADTHTTFPACFFCTCVLNCFPALNLIYAWPSWPCWCRRSSDYGNNRRSS